MEPDLQIAITPSGSEGHDGALGQTAARGWPLVPVFALALFSSAALIFTIEPVIGKMVLPLLGGAPAVWNTCIVFFQAVTLGGYVYAHLLTTWLRDRAQIAVHLILLAAAAAVLPISIGNASPAAGASPAFWLLTTLVSTVCAPMLLLCATAPLLQKWFATTADSRARDPYFLYAASNLGSMLALVSYPLLIEPRFSLADQSHAWTAGYFVLAALALVCGVSAYTQPHTVRRSVAAIDDPTAFDSAVTWPRRARWLALSLVPSSLMLSATTYLSTDIAAVPLLWTIPLALYLLSFVLSFAATAVVSNHLLRNAIRVLTLPIVMALALGATRPVWLLLPLHLLVLFVFALALHTDLAGERPATMRLTEFYLWIAVGGVLGGLLNTLIAPLIFTTVVEYPLGVAAACLLRPLRSGCGARLRPSDFGIATVAASLTAAVILNLQHPSIVPPQVMASSGAAILFTYVVSTKREWAFPLTVSFMLLVSTLIPVERGQQMYAGRTFFGVYRVWQVTERSEHRLSHGTTLHGGQIMTPGREHDPLFYYHRSGPIGQVFDALDERLVRARVGVVGLGAGELAAYATGGQQWTFYEIDPEIERIARNRRLFTYMERCGEQCSIVLGDARLSLARERGPKYALLIVDAFSSDAIPVHLATREAFALYFDRLEEDGVLAFHVSNRHLDLRPLLAGLAVERGYTLRSQAFKGAPDDPTQTASTWVVVGRSAQSLGRVATDTRWTELRRDPGMRIWTDDFSDILSVLKPFR